MQYKQDMSRHLLDGREVDVVDLLWKILERGKLRTYIGADVKGGGSFSASHVIGLQIRRSLLYVKALHCCIWTAGAAGPKVIGGPLHAYVVSRWTKEDMTVYWR